MYNTFLNRYYLSNANRSVAFAETKNTVQDILLKANFGSLPASGSGASKRGKGPHQSRTEQLRSLWMRHVSLSGAEPSVQSLQSANLLDQEQNFCGKTN